MKPDFLGDLGWFGSLRQPKPSKIGAEIAGTLDAGTLDAGTLDAGTLDADAAPGHPDREGQGRPDDPPLARS